MVVCDSLGVGQAPDAERFGDEGANTLGNCARAVSGLRVPHLEAMGLGFLTHVPGVGPRADPGTAHGRLIERSAGKDSTTGHWELAGVILDRPFPTFPHGFPPEVIDRFERRIGRASLGNVVASGTEILPTEAIGPFEERIGRRVLGNRPASGTEIIEELGREHLATGRPIVYTSADSVFQVAAHTSAVPLDTLYR